VDSAKTVLMNTTIAKSARLRMGSEPEMNPKRKCSRRG